MKQVMQNYKTGELSVSEVPVPQVKASGVLVKNHFSAVSAGTEKTKVDTAKMSLLQKARSRPDQVQQVVTNIHQEGVVPTVKKVFNKLDTPISLGYCSMGEVIEVGANIDHLKVGDRVACAGEGFAAHADIVSTPQSMCTPVPDQVSGEEAAFAAVGAIALQAVRLAQLELGYKVAVMGLGLVGQLVVQLARISGASVFGLDLDDEKIALAQSCGMELGGHPGEDHIEAMALDFSDHHGVDAVIIAAGGQQSDNFQLAGSICREKGRVVLLGAGDIQAPRQHFYEKELDVVISRAQGPGSYDAQYLQGGDYPIGYSRWTVQRNMATFLHLLAQGRLDLSKIITHRYSVDQAQQAYQMINTQSERYIGIVFRYDQQVDIKRKIMEPRASATPLKDIRVGFIGAGSFAQNYVLPVLKKHSDVALHGVATATGINAKNAAVKFGFDYSTTDADEIINDDKINTVFIVTRHDLHAAFTIAALKAGKRVWVEKPLAMNSAQLHDILAVSRQQGITPMVGFNRRFAPLVLKLKGFFQHRTDPLMINYRVNAGLVPHDHWMHQGEGGGRIVGEMCHFLDFFQFLTNARPTRVYASAGRETTSQHPLSLEDNVSVNLSFSDGSVAQLLYTAKGDLTFSRERIEVYGEQSIGVIDNFKHLSLTREGKTKKTNAMSREMGVQFEVEAFIQHLMQQETAQLIPLDHLYWTTLCSFKIIESLQTGTVITLEPDDNANLSSRRVESNSDLSRGLA